MRRQYGDALPLFGIGHSLGAKVLLLASCDPDARSVYHPTANIFIAFSNPAIRNAVPLPQLDSDDAQRAVQGVSSFLRNLGENMDLSAFGTSVKTPNLDRVASFVDNIGDALKGKEFSPTPEETFALVGSRYPITPNLLLKFMSDSIDDTDLLLPILQARFGSRKILFRLLRGNHVTVMTPDFNDGSFSTLGVDAFEQPVRNAARVVSDELEAAVACVAAFVKLQTDISSPS